MADNFVFKPTIIDARQWATGNYPAGAFSWSGTPKRVDPVANQHTPGEHPAAQEINFLVGDASDRLREARADLLRIQRINEAAAMQWLTTDATEVAGVAVTPRGRVVVGAFAAGALDHSTMISNSRRFAFGATPATGGNNTPTCCVANGEKVLCGDSPNSFIADCDSPGLYTTVTPGGTSMLLDAVSDGTGWIGLFSNSLTAGNNTTNVRGPRVFRGQPAASLEVRTVNAAGAVGSDTANSHVQNALSIYTTDEAVKLALIRCGTGTIAFFSSAFTGEKFRFSTSIDGGNTWVNQAANLPLPYPGQDVVGSLEWDSISSCLVLAMSRGTRTTFYRSFDLGATWLSSGEHVRNGTDPGAGSLVSCYDLRRSASGVIMAVGFSVMAVTAASYFPVFASIDQGRTWMHVGMVPDAAAGFPTFCAQDAPLMSLGGAGNGFSVPIVPLFGFGTAGG